LYRIATRLQRLGIDLSHSLMSDWLVQCADLLVELHARMLQKVLSSGHVFTDDAILPLQNHGQEPTVGVRPQSTTIQAADARRPSTIRWSNPARSTR
jgi:hypothetical protein